MFIDRKTQYFQDGLSPQLGLQTQCILTKIPSYLVNIDQLIPKFIWLGQRLRIVKTTLKENNKVREVTPLTTGFSIKLQ